MSIVNDSSSLCVVGKRDDAENKRDFSREDRYSFFSRWFYQSLTFMTVAARNRIRTKTVDEVVREEVGRQLRIQYERGFIDGRRSTLPPMYMRRAAA